MWEILKKTEDKLFWLALFVVLFNSAHMNSKQEQEIRELQGRIEQLNRQVSTVNDREVKILNELIKRVK